MTGLQETISRIFREKPQDEPPHTPTPEEKRKTDLREVLAYVAVRDAYFDTHREEIVA